MLKIIDGKRYDTETATEVASYGNGLGGSDFRNFVETLYKTAKGAWFIAGSGGAMTSYAESVGNGSTSGEGLRPVSANEAMAWLEKYEENDALNEHFADHIEDA